MQEIHMQQRIDQRSTGLLHRNRYRLTGEAIPQQFNPALQGLWRVLQFKSVPLLAMGFLQSHDVFLIRPIQSNKCGNFDILFRHLQISPTSPCLKTVPAGSAHKPYSRVLEGQHLSICPASRADRVRKSPATVCTVGWLVRNATQPVFHKGNSLQKEKRTKKEKQRPVENATAVEIGTIIGGLRHRFSEADSHRCLEKPRLTLGFPTLPTGPTAIPKPHDFQNPSLRTIRGGCAIKKSREATKIAQTGWLFQKSFLDHHPGAHSRAG
jgi:hypothetical protein